MATKLSRDALYFLALGGSGEIGMNVNLYGSEGKWLMVDLGISFADPAYPGIDVLLPDLQFIEDRLDDLVGIVLTHGHEDHIGAIPYLAADLGVPLYAAKFTAGLIREKLQEEGIADKVKLRVVDREKRFDVGPFGVTMIPLAHSIPDASALKIETAHGTIVHSGDWKIDAAPVLGVTSTAETLAEIGDAGVLMLACDSTNVFNETSAGSEADVRKGLDEVVRAAKGRVLVTTFASNAARLHTLGEVAQDCGRTMCVAGRSIERILRVARQAGYLKDFPPVVDFDAAMRLPPDQVMIAATGGQGEARAALARIAFDNHPLKLDAGDTVVFSSRQIPGNEQAIGRIQNALAGRGVRMITDREAHVHVSGHPGRPDLAAMYKLIKPEILIPVHGEMRHLAEHGRFALEQGIDSAIVQANGTLIKLAPGKPELVGHERVGRLMLDGDVILPADGSTINERRKAAENGVVSVAFAVDGKRRLRGRPEITALGLPIEEDRDEFVAEVEDAVTESVAKGERDLARLKESVRLSVRRRATQWTGKKPVVVVSVLAA